MSEAQRLQRAISCAFDTGVSAVDLDRQTVSFSGPGGATKVSRAGLPAGGTSVARKSPCTLLAGRERSATGLQILLAGPVDASYVRLLQALHYDLLVGADGRGSIVRGELEKMLPPGFCTHIRARLHHPFLGRQAALCVRMPAWHSDPERCPRP